MSLVFDGSSLKLLFASVIHLVARNVTDWLLSSIDRDKQSAKFIDCSETTGGSSN